MTKRRAASKKFQHSVGSKSAQTSKIREAYGEILEDPLLKISDITDL